ncbi:MAG: hydantoinase B/oxoprolinase family protein [Gammaproteobacteria bacterium]|nr:hydantoinase B/oxoprolinase family protein [Gammaproteobacteria bacterium]
MRDLADDTSGWQFWIDRGGTFTDLVARAPDGRLISDKLLSDHPERYADAATEGIRRLLAAHGEPGARVDAVKMGTTVATNALLERRGTPTVLAITAGHADALRIGTQSRPDIFARQIVLPEMLYSRVIEIDERIGVDGAVVRPLDADAARSALKRAFDDGFRSVAIVLIHGWQHHAHEARVAAMARDIGYSQVSVSHELSPLQKLVPRGDTTVVDAYLSPVLRDYVSRVERELANGARLQFMQSNGGLVAADAFRGKDAVLSGPAGGINGMAVAARAAGFAAVVGFDMGGTSTDVSHWAGQFERRFETTVAGVRLRTPMLDIHTIAAGGGSICHFDGARLRVGPESAGAVPGPAAYRRGGPLTITDCNVLLGRLQARHFPAVFGPDGDAPLDTAAVRAKFEALAAAVSIATGQAQTAEHLAAGFIRMAVADMARAITAISTERGHDVRQCALLSFGGAGGQHACAVAEALGITAVLLHPLAGVLSAWGIGQADVRVLRERSIEQPLTDDDAALRAAADALSAAAQSALDAQRDRFAERCVTVAARLKRAGTDAALEVPFGTPDAMRLAFAAAHRAAFGFAADDAPLIVEMLVAEAVGSAPRLTATLLPPAAGADLLQPLDHVEMHDGEQSHRVPVWRREQLPAGFCIDGPALLLEATGTTIVDAGWRASIDAQANLILRREAAVEAQDAARRDADPVALALFNSRFMAIAERMGERLRATATSVNIKERLDFSCALFDADAHLIANAPHIPVHLGSMGDSVRAIVDARGASDPLRPGDVRMLNNPYRGGTHLPDVTVVMPVFDADEVLIAFVAARGHHADIGGITPGSMPPGSTSIADEGVLIDDFLLVEQGRLREAETRALLTSGSHPARNPDRNLADLKAQIAACASGAEELRALAAQLGRDRLAAWFGHVQDNAEAAVREVIGRLADGANVIEMDDGAQIRVAVRSDRETRSATVDFTGTSAQLSSNFNAPRAIARAAVLYVFRCLIDDALPLNDGCLRPIRMIVPEGSMLNPRPPAAVVAGNVETSQAITDALFAALGALAGSQGTMNNFTFGNAAHQYYETICGGAGAGPGFDGASAVQTHMTNSRLTDVEVLEARHPLRVERFAIRHGSGGDGAQRGGDGVIRVFRFLQPMTAGILSNRRRVPPRGLAGGGDAACGSARVTRADGRVEWLAGTDSVVLDAGDSIVIETPGGGGYGCAAPDRAPG